MSKSILFQIDDLPPIGVIMKGYALPHQVHIALPRTIEPYLYENMYNVIACLTSPWFYLFEVMFISFVSTMKVYFLHLLIHFYFSW